MDIPELAEPPPPAETGGAPHLARRGVLLVVLGLVCLCEQVLGAHDDTLPLIRLAPALMLAGLLSGARGEAGILAIMALAVDMLAMALAPHGTLVAAGVALHGGASVGMALLAAWYLRRRRVALAGGLGLRALLDLSVAALAMAAPIGLIDATLAHAGRASTSAHLLFGFVGPVALGVVTLVPLMLMRPEAQGPRHLPVALPRPARLVLPLMPAGLVVVSFLWPTPVLAVLMPVAMVTATLALTLRQTLVSMALAAIVATCTAAMNGDGLVPALAPDALDAIRARWLAWMAGQITLSTALGAAWHMAGHVRHTLTGHQAMLRALPQGAFRADLAGRWLWLSPSCEALVPGAAPGAPLADLVAPTRREALERALARLSEGAAPMLTLRLPLARQDEPETRESPRQIDLSLAIMHDGQGTPIGFAGTLRDATRDTAELAAAHQAQAGWQELCDAAPVGIVRSDARGIITYANWAAELTALAGQRRAMGQTLRAWLADDPAFDLPMLESRLPAPGAQTSHELGIGAPGRCLWLSVVVTAKFDATGRRTGYVVAVTDISARKRMESELIEARRRAEAAAQAKSAFLASVSHEIRTPMNGVIGLCDLLLERDLDETSRRYASLIGQSGATMMELLGGVLDLTKLDAGALTLTEEVVDLPRLLGDSMALMGAPAMRKGLDTRLEIAPDLPAMIHGDRLRLHQILANLIGNAVKFTRHGHITLRAHAQGPRLHIAVEDTGIGIAPRDQADVFEDFVQVGRHAQRAGGTGLGLPITRRLVMAMGGEIRLDSAPGRGTAVHLVLPLRVAGERRQSAASTRPRPAGGRPLHVLVVDDNLTNQIIAGGMLGRLGHSHVTAGDGAAVVDLVEQARARGRPFDAVLMDMLMPVMDGLDAARALRAAGHDAAGLPIVAVTANAYEEDIAACLAAGMQAHLAKPLNVTRLGEVLAAVTSGHGATPAERRARPEESNPTPG
jgi:PAS domain S-box-containing protein